MSQPPETSGRPAEEVTVTEARGAVRTGRAIWILAISLTLAIVLVLGLWLLHAPGMSKVTHPQARDFSNRDISTYNMASPGARTDAGDSQTAGNAQ